MAQPDLSDSLNSLQSTINLILIETGRYFRSCSGEETYPSLDENSRLQATLRNSTEVFQQILDGLESEILKSKASFLHELEYYKSDRTTNSCLTLSHSEDVDVVLLRQTKTLTPEETVVNKNTREIETIIIEDEPLSDPERQISKKFSPDIQIGSASINGQIQYSLVGTNIGTMSVGTKFELENDDLVVKRVNISNHSHGSLVLSEDINMVNNTSMKINDLGIEQPISNNNIHVAASSHIKNFYNNNPDLKHASHGFYRPSLHPPADPIKSTDTGQCQSFYDTQDTRTIDGRSDI